jgi:hypothetical protein
MVLKGAKKEVVARGATIIGQGSTQAVNIFPHSQIFFRYFKTILNILKSIFGYFWIFWRYIFDIFLCEDILEIFWRYLCLEIV